MLALFLNPGFLFIAGALVSVPIIIHLINRMRYKRVRWAAMEFLLKAQKRTRKRLIIEQLLLLALRCLLIALVGLLVSRFVGCSDANLGGKPNLHLAILDDTLSMQDQWKQADGTSKNCFDVAKTDLLIKKIAKGLSQSKTNERLVILPLSKINDPDYQPKVYEGLNNPDRLKELTQDINEMQPSMLHVTMLQGVKVAEKIIGNHADSRVTLHLLSDFRHKDWSHPAGEGLTKELLDLVNKNKDMKIRPIDTVYPPRTAGQGGYPSSRDNVGILDVRPSTRIVGKNMPVQFTIAIKNFSGKQVEAMLLARDEVTGKEMQEVDFSPQNPIKLAPSSVTNVTFEKRFNPDIKAGDNHFAHVTLRLVNPQMQPLDNDGLLADNLRHAVVEVRDKVPILVIDGDPKGRDEGKDSFFISRSLISVPGASYHVVYGDELAGGDAARALERPDLNQFPTIFLLNVRDLKPKQLANLENYVKEGGGVAFYMGPLVNAAYYNKSLYKDGKGIFPAPLKETYFPSPNDAALEPKGSDTFQLLIRDDKFPDPRNVPIFGAMFEEPKHREPLRDLPIRRYFQVARNLWKPEPGRVFELATMPNDASILVFQETIIKDIRDGANTRAILADPELKKYHTRFQRHLNDIVELVRPGSEARAYHLANKIDFFLTDKGSTQQKELFPDMTEFWASSNDKVQSLKRELTNLRDQVSYGDAFIVAQNFGKGKVVAVMSTAGKDWNDWAGGSAASVLYPTFVWEMQNYLTSQGSEANLSVGANIELALDAEQFKGAQLKMIRHFMKPQTEKPSERVKAGEQFGREDHGQIVFTMTKNLEPGLYISEVVDENAPDKPPITVLAHAFNVDTTSEGDLQRVGSEELDRELLAKSNGQIKLVTPGAPDEALLGKFNDFSESPWLFLILLLVLVAEQALAVHLSFHMKSNEHGPLTV